MLFARSLSGTSNVLQSPFPAKLQLAADLHRQLRQLGSGARISNQLSPTQTLSTTVLISYVCRISENALRLPSCAFPHEAQLALVPVLPGWQTRRLTPPCFHRMKP